MSKRGQNEGSIYKRNDGRWVAVVNLGYQNGRRGRKSFYGDTRREVQERLTQVLRDQQQGLPVATERQTVGQFLQNWLIESVKPAVRPMSYIRYEQLVRIHLSPALGKIPLQKLAPQHVQALLNQKLAEGLSPRTVQYVRATLRFALNQALRWGLVARNAAALVDSPQVKRPEIGILDVDQARKLLESVKGHRLEALYSVALALGLRQGEALALRWQDVNFENQTLRVTAALQRIDGRLQFVEPKTSQSRRTINLPAVIVTALREHRIRQLEEKLFAGSRWQESGLLFTSSIGTPLDGCNVTKGFQKMLERAGLPKIRFHDLRHTCASLLLAQGVHPRAIMETLGHSQISLTMNTYSHVMPAIRKEVADRMDEILTGVK